ncbi:MAG: hypothetical protein Q4B73_01300 [Lachnospiraceae bacterium]|nr:hypothetical protein [Lachnospiraceae bacterium]
MKTGHKVRVISLIVVLVLLLMAVVGGTYAWFSRNRVTSTDRVTSRTGEESVELYVSSQGGAGFRQQKEAAIVQVNNVNLTNLQPVSTGNLKTFLYSAGSSGNVVSSFLEDTEGKLYYHGRIYLQAVMTGQNAGKKLDLYLDTGREAGGAPVQAAKPEILNGSRLGLTFNGGNPVILSLSQNHNVGDEEYKTTTVVNGAAIGPNQVLTTAGGQVQAVADPSRYYGDYSIAFSDGSARLPGAALLRMESNQIYTVDIYYYLEGCDTDCNMALALEDVSLHLSFYGVLA